MYPAEMHQAIRAAWNSPEGVHIPTSSPSALRLSFYGLFGAYRKNDQAEIVDGLSIYLTADGIRIGRSVEEQFSAEIRAALQAHKKPEAAPIPADGWDDEGDTATGPDHVAEARAMLERLGARK